MSETIQHTRREELRELQSERLRETVAYAYENVPFYREALDEAGVAPSDIEQIDDVRTLPFTTKADFRDEYPDGLFAVADADIRRIHASSGTTGKPKIVSYTEGDLELWDEVMARSMDAAGLDPGETFQNAYGYGLFTGGLGFHGGAEAFGATVIPIGGGNTQRQVELARDLESDAIGCTPSYALYFAETAEEMGVDPRELPVSTVLYGAEPCTEPMREEIEERLDATGIENYGLSELIGPGVAVECHEAQDGMHVWEDHFYPEVVDPRTGEVLPEGAEGELVLTSLTKEALPVLRYRTGDLTTLTTDECDCGRTMVRMDGVTGRADDLIIVRGVNLYPSEIEAVVLEFEAVAPYYRIDLDREDTLDTLELTIELEDGFDGDRDRLRSEILERLQNALSFTPDELELVEYGTLERTEVGKVKRVYDHR
ncbi:phenylacetate--CoA ligase [Haloterrigena sp. SYSU A558-1]|uniref:Phenylacetate--CoA ligase n=1 Tax=Haloterrigena gelatinilytica TaxID=2741724 RepID=A0A8J8GQ51_9EURY|nr:phenylacetate--CoA ligase PaaK [Haloterrigena gelatinilytica]NUB93150.1 phenylacetate--CoA ligase [Haloterrigena gelatinilytica]NUC70940.1 phenylacetate--CoA ligase [Haloterrigena gelatinilytica]